MLRAWGAVGRTHTIVRLQTRTRRTDGTENFGGFVYVLDGYLQRDLLLWVFMCSINFSLFFRVSFPAATPGATTPHRSLFRLPRRGLPRLNRCIQANRPTRLQGYHTRATTLHTNFWVQEVITPAGSYSYFSFHRLLRQCFHNCLLYTSPSPRDLSTSRMPSSA